VIMDSDTKPENEAPCNGRGQLRGSVQPLKDRLDALGVKVAILTIGPKVTDDGRARLECILDNPEKNMIHIKSFTTFFDYVDPSENDDLCLSPNLFLPKMPTHSPTAEPTDIPTQPPTTLPPTSEPTDSPTSSPTFSAWCTTTDQLACVKDFKCTWTESDFCKVGKKFKCQRWANYFMKRGVRYDQDRCEDSGGLLPYLEKYNVQGCRYKPKKKRNKQCRGKFSLKAIAPVGSPGGDN